MYRKTENAALAKPKLAASTRPISKTLEQMPQPCHQPNLRTLLRKPNTIHTLQLRANQIPAIQRVITFHIDIRALGQTVVSNDLILPRRAILRRRLAVLQCPPHIRCEMPRSAHLLGDTAHYHPTP